MDVTDIDFTDDGENEQRDLIAESGQIVRGETLALGAGEHVRALVDELGGALRSLLEDADIASAERARAVLDRLEPNMPA